MAKLEIPGSVKRFGTRYGKTVKVKLAFIEKEQRSLHKCPKCNNVKVKRVAAGIWKSGKCDYKFAGKAYTPGKKAKLIEEVSDEELNLKTSDVLRPKEEEILEE